MKLILSIILSFTFFSCTKTADKSEDKNKELVNGISKFSAESKRDSFNLLQNNMEIPDSCKPPISTEVNKRAFVKLRGRINRCAFFIPQYPELNRFGEVQECLESVGDFFSAVPDQTCKELLIVPGAQGNIVEVMNTLLLNFYTGNVRVIEGNETVFKWEHVKDYFSLWSDWFRLTRNSMFKLDDELVISVNHAKEFESKVLRPFWNDLQDYTVEWKSTFGDIVKDISPTNPDGSPRTPEEIAELRLDKNKKFQVFKTMLEVNQRVIDLAFESDLAKKETRWIDGSPNLYASPLLAAIIGDAIQPFYDRIQVITKIYDVACKLKNCKESFYQGNKTYWMIKYFHSLSQGQAPEAIDLDRTDGLNNFLMTLIDKKAEIQDLLTATNSSFNVGSIANANIGSDFPSFLTSFADIFSQSFDMVQNFENTKTTDQFGIERAGYFSTGNISEVNVGFSKANMDRHIKNVKNSNDKLIILRDSFARQKHTLIQEVLSLNSSRISIDQLEDKINLDLTDLFVSNNKIDSVRHFISESKDSYADQVKGIIANQQIGQEEFFTFPEQTFVANAADTAVGNPDVIDGAYLMELDPNDEIVKGDMLQINVSGEWSPTCAVTQVYGNSVVGAKTSGKGFTLIETDGQSTVKSVDDYSTKESFQTQSVSVEVCAGGSFGYGSAKACASSTYGTRTAQGQRKSTTNSQSRRSDASFDIGVTLQNTPYPFQPAGSLLLVMLYKGQNQKLAYRDIRILRGNDNIVVPDNGLEFYLVGNDCSSTNNSGALTVKMTRQSAVGA